MNLKLAFRPLVGGIGIVPSTTRRWATLGFCAVGAGKRWIVTAAHAIDQIPAGSNLTIHQGPWGEAGHNICDANSNEIRSDPLLDVAAIPLTSPNVQCLPEIIGLGAWTGKAQASPGMKVIKIGVGSGFSVGEVASVTNSAVTIRALVTYPNDYGLSEKGDSGAAWLSWPSLRVVAIHRAETIAGEAVATDVEASLTTLGLSLAQ